MKNVLIISSSARRGGNSDTLCEQFKKGAEEKGNKVEKIFLNDYTIHNCKGCQACYSGKRICAQKDDMSQLLPKMLWADVVVLATPVYFYSVCGAMKTFLDRCVPLYGVMEKKEFYFMLSAAETSKQPMQRVVEVFRGFTDCFSAIEEKGIVWGLGADQKGSIKNLPAFNEAYNFGKNV